MSDLQHDPPSIQASDLPAVSSGAVDAFERSLPAIIQTVSERFRIESDFTAEAPRGEDLEFLQDSHTHFGRTMLGICAFGFFARLPEEAAWYLRTLEHRGFGPDAFVKVIRSWAIAILAALHPAPAREIVRPFAWIEAHVGDLRKMSGERKAQSAPEAEAFLELIRRNERARAAAYAASLLEGGTTLERVLDGVILGSLARIGALWETNEISVAEEHIATAGIREAALRFFERVPRLPDRRAVVAVACVPGNEHDLGPEILSRYLETKGWRAVFIGRSTPEAELVRAMGALAPAAALFSIPLIAQLVPGLRVIERVKREMPGVTVIVGGRAAVAAAETLAKAGDAVAGSFADAGRLLAERVKGHA